MQNLNIQVFGSGCPSCKKLHAIVENIAKEIDTSLEVQYSDDIAKLVELGAMASPALAINEEIIFAGKIPSDEEIKEIILEKLNS